MRFSRPQPNEIVIEMEDEEFDHLIRFLYCDVSFKGQEGLARIISAARNHFDTHDSMMLLNRYGTHTSREIVVLRD